MNRFLKLLSLCLFLTLTVPLQAVTNGVANEPDSVYLFSYSHADGSGGLKLAWSPDGNRWFSVADGNSFVNSDFGPWGQKKRMLKPSHTSSLPTCCNGKRRNTLTIPALPNTGRQRSILTCGRRFC